MKKSGFTLIELLVVIAIIAILAAILFPVFAQAKASAKMAASLSNVKQEGLACIMYGADYDDVIVRATFWNTGKDPLTFGNGLAFSTWAYTINPYVKNADILQDPVGPSTPTLWNSRVLALTSHPGYAFNYVWLSPYEGTPAKMRAVSFTAVASSANTVMLVNRGSYGDGDHYFWGFDFNAWTTDSPLLNTTVETPDCYTIPQWCADGWGKGGWGSGVNTGNYDAGYETGGVAKRVAKSTTVCWVDGHATKAQINSLAAGTNYNPNNPPSMTAINDYNKYPWDTNQ